jgi:murein DD-endopeptidase MepM/ murein hydrolase activator NlpD
MNLFLAWNIFSYRRELAYVATSFFLVILLPIIAVIVLTQTGINVVSDTLAEINEVTQVVELKNPLDGSIYKSIEGPFVWPTTGVITLEFAQSSKYQLFHTGLDIAGKRGDPITPFMDGKVIYAGEISWGYGKHIVIDHGDNVTSIYAHLDKIYVAPGQEVEPGDIIGTEGSTGWSTGPHLHFETRVFGIPVNPRVFLGYN